nr:class I SAM-dependent methyltransferase [Candidatus Sigynarchaeota archaeon]
MKPKEPNTSSGQDDKLATHYKEVISFELRGFNPRSRAQYFWRLTRTKIVLKNLDLKYFNKRTQTTVADVGSGPGLATAFFAKRGYKMRLYDRCKPFLLFAQESYKKQGIDAEFIFADIDKDTAIFQRNGCDAVICIDAFEHFKDPVQVLRHFLLLLGNKGRVYLTTPNFGNRVFSLIEKAWDVVGRTPGWSDLHITRMSFNEMVSLFKNAGFKIENAGTFLLLSPLIAVVSTRLANVVSYLENFFLRNFHVGFMMYIVASI